MTSKIVVIGQFPPVITGQSLITQYIFEKLIVWGAKPLKIAFNQIEESKWVNYIFFYYNFFKKCSSKNLIIYLSPARSNLGYLRNFIIIHYANFLNNKIVLHYHCGDYDDFLSTANFFVKSTYKQTFSKVHFHIFLSSRLLTNFKKLLIPEDKIVIIPNSITNSMEGSEGGFIKKSQLIKLVFLSNMIPSKGYLILLQAVEILISTYRATDFECHFFGKFISEDSKNESELENEFRALIEKKKLSQYVKYGGVVFGEEKQKILKDSHVFILPTKYPVEAQPLSILEALSNNMLVIASDYRAIPDMIIDNETGILLNEITPVNLAYRINLVFENIGLYTQVANNGKVFFEQNFSSFIFDKKLKSFFNNFDLFPK